MKKVGIIGGSGLDDPQIMKDSRVVKVTSSYGELSSPLKIGVIANCEVVLLARHGLEHTIPPSQVNYRANISALKDQGCDYLLATTAVGSLQDEIERGDLVILDQFIDFTRHRSVTFHDSFPPGEAKHTGMADPFDEQMRTILIERCEALGYHHHPKGTVVTIEGPRFSTRAESHMFRAWGADVINMSIAPECALANEAGLPYAAVAISTDYDCWKQEEEPVSWDKILEVFNQNVDRVTRLIVETVGKLNSL